MKKQIKHILVAGMLLATSQAFAGGGQIGSAGSGERLLLGRLIESNCNTPTGIAEVKAVVFDEEANEMKYVALNLVNDQLCTKGRYGWMDSAIVNMSMASILGTTDGTTARPVLHQILVNGNGIAKDVKEVHVTPELESTYRKFDFRDFNSYKPEEYRIFNSGVNMNTGVYVQRTPELAAKVLELAK